MTFSLRKLLFVAPVFVVVGIAAACGPYGNPCNPPSTGSCPSGPWTPAPKSVVWPAYPATGKPTPAVAPSDAPTACASPVVDCSPPPQAPVTYRYIPVTNSKGQTHYIVQSTYAGHEARTTLSIHEGKIRVQSADGSQMLCEKFTIPLHGGDSVEVGVVGKEIRLESGKDRALFQASAQKVTRSGAEGATLVLEGNAKLLCSRQDKKIDVATDRVSVNLLTGQVIGELNVPSLTPPTAPRGSEPARDLPADAVPPPTSGDLSPPKRSTDPLKPTELPRTSAPAAPSAKPLPR